MENIPSVSGKLLYLAREMLAKNSISKKQQGVFKDLIFAQSPSVFNAYENYVAKGTQLTLIGQLISIIRKQKENENWEGQSSTSKKSSKKGRSMKIIIPPKNIQKMPAEMNRI